MPGFWARRKLKKTAETILHHALHIRAMREDVASPAALADLDRAVERVGFARNEGDAVSLDAAAKEVEQACGAVWPPRPMPALRENLEIAVVALGVAMALRCFFIQPFRIPTGSMQPTLFGVQVRDQDGARWYDRLPFSLAGWAVMGEGYVETRAKVSGYVGYAEASADGESVILRILATPSDGGGFAGAARGGVPHSMRKGLIPRVQFNEFVSKGQVLASGRVKIGDHVFVDKIRYNFAKPKRGDIIVFETAEIQYPDLRGEFYIKRLVALPGESVAIHAPHLIIDGRAVEVPFPFHRMVHGEGYNGYEPASGGGFRPPVLGSADDAIRLGRDEYLPLGDNTRSSLDGRYFGPVKRPALVGPAFMIYWPASSRWGRVR